MKKLELNQMEVINGDGCGSSAGALAFTFATAFIAVTPIGAAVFAVAFIWGSINTAMACQD